ncbi:MAG: OmpA family protein [Nitrospira sp.]|nr:OmpA family protein [Nitrospira sp.]
MDRALTQSAAVMLIGIVLFSNQGCSTKLLKSDSEGERVTGSVGTSLPISGDSRGDTNLQTTSEPRVSGDTNPLTTSEEHFNDKTKQPTASEESSIDGTELPSISEQDSNGTLRGFSTNPSEEHLAEGKDLGALPPSGIDPRQRAELTNEEKAAQEAGFRDIFFGFDHWTLSDTGMEALNHNAAYLHNHPTAVLTIEGHCDERGTAEYNIVLGYKRAKAARNYLLEALVNPEQVAIVSYGKERPFCLDRDESCHEQNRRDHMLLTINE